jgi:hypothetical protein
MQEARKVERKKMVAYLDANKADPLGDDIWGIKTEIVMNSMLLRVRYVAKLIGQWVKLIRQRPLVKEHRNMVIKKGRTYLNAKDGI